MTRALLPLLRVGRRKTVVNLSSGAGSIAARGGQGGWGMRSLAYKASKAAINMGTSAPWEAGLLSPATGFLLVLVLLTRKESAGARCSASMSLVAVCFFAGVMDSTWKPGWDARPIQLCCL